jgi:hypothetical protein
MSRDAALEFFARLLHDGFFQGIGATRGQNRAREAKSGGEGFQALRIMGLPVHCKNFGMTNRKNDEARMTNAFTFGPRTSTFKPP